jgi:type I restriction enzyme M protein
MDAAEYKHVVLGLLFLKYVSDKFEFRQQRLAQMVADESSDYFMPTEDARKAVLEDRDEYTAEGVFWVPAGHRWSDLRKVAKQADIGQRIDAAMEAIEKENPSLKGVLPKNYARRELTAATLGGLIDTFSRDDLAAAEHSGLDVLGRVYEYFLAQFASNEGKNAGSSTRRVRWCRYWPTCFALTTGGCSIRAVAREACSCRPSTSWSPTAARATTSRSSARSPTRPRGGWRR